MNSTAISILFLKNKDGPLANNPSRGSAEKETMSSPSGGFETGRVALHDSGCISVLLAGETR